MKAIRCYYDHEKKIDSICSYFSMCTNSEKPFFSNETTLQEKFQSYTTLHLPRKRKPRNTYKYLEVVKPNYLYVILTFFHVWQTRKPLDSGGISNFRPRRNSLKQTGRLVRENSWKQSFVMTRKFLMKLCCLTFDPVLTGSDLSVLPAENYNLFRLFTSYVNNSMNSSLIENCEVLEHLASNYFFFNNREIIKTS